jgi:hypothetical protein
MTSFTRFRQILDGNTRESQVEEPLVLEQEDMIKGVEEEQETVITSNDPPIVEVLLSKLKDVFGFHENNLTAEEHAKKIKDMTKLELDKYAEQYNIYLDRRQTKQNMINEFIQKLKEKN